MSSYNDILQTKRSYFGEISNVLLRKVNKSAILSLLRNYECFGSQLICECKTLNYLVIIMLLPFLENILI